MQKNSERDPPRRVGLRAVAEAAKVSLMTVSLALRNSPRLSAPTRERVRAIAEKLGYRPDPEISRLMSRLLPSRKPRGSVVIAMISLHAKKPVRLNPYEAEIRRGIQGRADALGYGVALFSLADYRGGLKQILHVLRHRGINGAILLPSDEAVALDPALDWTGFSVVAATTTIISPTFHRVVPNQVYNIMTLLERLQHRGRRRIAAIVTESLDARTHRLYSIACTWHGHGDRLLVLSDRLAESTIADRTAAWIKRHHPDALLVSDAIARALAVHPRAAIPSELEIIALTNRSDFGIAFLDQRPAAIGERAVSLLTGMMHNHETGVPDDPQDTMIRGVLREPPTHVAAAR